MRLLKLLRTQFAFVGPSLQLYTMLWSTLAKAYAPRPY